MSRAASLQQQPKVLPLACWRPKPASTPSTAAHALTAQVQGPQGEPWIIANAHAVDWATSVSASGRARGGA